MRKTGGAALRRAADTSPRLVNESKEKQMSKLWQRLQREEGFTLIELLVVIVIIGILLAIAVPSYLGFKDRANKAAAGANVRSAVPSVEAFYADNGTYAGMTLAALQAIDSGINITAPVAAQQTANTYCVSSTVGGFTWVKRLSNPPNPVTDKVQEGTCP
jgi:prepilin-type N-terminal cleavage/methylation domain-containing protein